MLARASSILFPPQLGGIGDAAAAAQTSAPSEGDYADGTRVGDLAMFLSILSSLVLIFRS
jgi:hypothetical protein